jgi:hypothetical protein
MKKQLIEEINRFRLLSGYNNTSTLTENLNVIVEQGGLGKDLQMLLKLGGTEAKTAARELEVIMRNELKGGVTILDEFGKPIGRAKTATEVLDAIAAGRISAAELGKVNMNLFKQTSDLTIKAAIATDIALTKSSILKLATKEEKAALQGMINKGMAQKDAELIIETYKKNGGKFNLTTDEARKLADEIGHGGTGRVTKVDPDPINPDPKNPDPKNPDPGTLKEKFKANWKKIFGYAAGIGGLSWLAWYLFLKDNNQVAQCLLLCATKEELESLNQTGTKDAVITKKSVGNLFADTNGGLVFGLDNGKVTTGNGQYEGEYECTADGIQVEFDEATFTIKGCKGPEENKKNETDNGGGGGTKWKDCSGTYVRGCKSEVINKVQGCLGGLVKDGKFGPRTEAALKAKGYNNGFKDSDVETICGGSTGQTSKNDYEDWSGVSGD